MKRPTQPLKIALTADPEIPVPPQYYGGIERIIDMLVRGLTDRGHEVTLFAHPESETGGELVSWPGKASQSVGDTARNAFTLAREVMTRDFDLIHSFSRIASLSPVLPLAIPKIMTYQRAISPRTTRIGHVLSRGTLSFTAISDWMMRDVSDIGRWNMVPNGVPMHVYDFEAEVPTDAPLVFLGRIEEIKGPHLAIEIARRTGRRLIIAGNIPPEKADWVQQNVMSLVDGELVEFIGAVDDAQKNKLLGQAHAFLMPILWDEPFGIVMAEALACGTPVLGLDRGAVPEVVEHGVTGFVSSDLEALIQSVDRVASIDRRDCRVRAEKLYSQDAVVDGYLDVYNSRLGRE